MAFLRIEARSVGVTLAEGLCELAGGSLRLKTSVTGEAGRASLELYPGICLKSGKSTENTSQGSRVATGLLVAPTWLSFEGLPRLACCTSVSPRSSQGPYKLPD
jgi:hypothetical protein